MHGLLRVWGAASLECGLLPDTRLLVPPQGVCLSLLWIRAVCWTC